LDFESRVREQFSVRSAKFDASTNWVTDEKLIRAHIDLAGDASGEALDLCCGTGQIGRALKAKGWNVKGLDVCLDMIEISSHYFSVTQGKAEKMPFESNRFNLVVCRQAFHFLDIKDTLSEINRVLVQQGIFIASLTTPFSDVDKDWLYEIHRTKQPLLLKFYTAQDLIQELKAKDFLIQEIRTLVVRESINRWMDYAPELNQEVREKVLSMVQNAPLAYKKLHHVQIVDGEIFEDWNWIVLKTVSSKK